MQNKKKVLILLCFILATFMGCSSNLKTQSNTTLAITSADHIKIKLTAKSILDKLKETEKNNITKIQIVTAENDKNKFLGKPNEYIEKIAWNDSRIQDSNIQSSIEVFDNNEDATSRKTYLEEITKATMFNQYIVQKDNVLLRVEGGLTPIQSNEYINVFNSIKN